MHMQQRHSDIVIVMLAMHAESTMLLAGKVSVLLHMKLSVKKTSAFGAGTSSSSLCHRDELLAGGSIPLRTSDPSLLQSYF